jgi:RNAse (barnase) inhibitor barstar
MPARVADHVWTREETAPCSTEPSSVGQDHPVDKEWVTLGREFPWLGRGFVYAVAEAYADQFASALADRGFTVATMRPRSADDFHDELAAALSFPGYYGKNWDATHDCFRDVDVAHPFALFWRNADHIAATDPKLFAEAAFVLCSELEALELRQVQALLVITGTGRAFRRPPAN